MQQTPEDIRGIGIQISRLEIMKHKSNTNCLVNFIKKAKQPISETNINESKQILESNKNKTDSNETKNIPKLINHETISKKSNFQTKSSSSSFENKIILPSQEIDDSILNELPEDIRKEIEASSKSIKSKTNEIEKKEKSKDSTKTIIQTKQELYFKERKNIPRGKAELPPLQEVDMSVLVELPEDIRNEILNEYKSNKKSETPPLTKIKSNDEISKSINTETKFHKASNYLTEERDFSFSQVDPEFLAALPDDMKDDVKMFCMIKRREKNNAEKKKIISTKSKGNLKSKRGRKPKNTVYKSNSMPLIRNEIEEKKIQQIFREEKEEEEENILNMDKKQENEDREMIAIISHVRSFSDNDVKSQGQEKALSALVKCMFDLSTDQVINLIY